MRQLAGRRPARPPPARRPPRARRGWQDGGYRRCPEIRASGRRFPCPSPDVLVIRVKVRRFSLNVFANAFGSGLAQDAIRILQEVQRRLERQFLAVHLEAQCGHGFVEQAVPGATAGDRFFVEQLLKLVLELVGPVLAQVDQPRTVMADGRNCRPWPFRSSASSMRLSSRL